MRLLSSFLKDRMVASIASTSSRTIDKMLCYIDFSRPLTIVEYGAGTGVITKALLERMTKDSTVIAFETNKELCDAFIVKDSRLTLVNDSCEKVEEYVKRPVDCIISGIPLSMMDKDDRYAIIRQARELLPTGTMLVYQTSAHPLPLLQKYFNSISQERCLLNIPPLTILCARP